MDTSDHDQSSRTDNGSPAEGDAQHRPTFELLEDEKFLELPTEAEIDALVELGDRLPEVVFEPEPEERSGGRPAAVLQRAVTDVASPTADDPPVPDFIYPPSMARRILDHTVDGLVVVVAVACVAAGVRPLLSDNSEWVGQPSLTETITNLVLPAAQPAPALEPGEDRDPLAVLGRELRVSVGRYEAMAEMFAQNRLSCAQLREVYLEVGDGWTAYSLGLARHRQDLSDGLAYRDESLYQEVQRVDSDFTISGCNRP